MDDIIKQAVSFYDINIKSTENLNHNDSFKITDNTDNQYFLKIYGKKNDDDIFSGKRVYHTYEQLQLESEILMLLSDSVLKTALPIKNKNGDFVTTLTLDSDGEPMFATITSFVNGLVKNFREPPTMEMAYIAVNIILLITLIIILIGVIFSALSFIALPFMDVRKRQKQFWQDKNEPA